jgi:hypothetical protein
MILFLIIGVPIALAALVARYGFALRRSLTPTERPSAAWVAALVLLLGADVVLVLAFLLAIAVYNCHGAYECPF